MIIHHLDVVITNGIVAIMGFYFGLALLQSSTMHYDLRRLLVGCFLALGVASAIAGYFHGYLQDFTAEEEPLRPIVWRSVILMLGLSSFYLWKLVAFFAFPQRFRKISDVVLFLLLMAYCYTVTIERDDFLVAAVFYLPAVVLLTVTLIVKWLTKKDARYFSGVLGLFITVVAIVPQAMKYDLHPQFLTHNAIYHLIQAVGFYYFYLFSKRIIVWK